ncbi:MAG: hypothetical protein GY816_04345 [Cytophagales bacterium]|nr:hypothetical protein [Cytophagales bacterium]
MRQFFYALLVVLILASCKDKVICPAFQSTYILDDSVRSTYFSYVWYLNEDERKSGGVPEPQILPPDSLGAMVASSDVGSGVDYFAYAADYKVTPKVPKRTKYGIVKRTPIIPNLVRNIQLKTSPMENVLTPPEVRLDEEVTPDPIPVDSSALVPLDSTASIAGVDSLNVDQPADSLAVAETQTAEDKKKAWVQFKYGFNPLDSMQPDQEYYFKRYGWLLQNAAPKDEPVNEEAQTNALDSVSSDSTSQKGLKGLFKKKDKPKKEKKKKDEEEPVSETPTENDEATKPEEVEEDDDSSDDGF